MRIKKVGYKEEIEFIYAADLRSTSYEMRSLSRGFAAHSDGGSVIVLVACFR